MKTFWLCFIPLFVAVDAIGVLPVFSTLIRGQERPFVRRLVLLSTLAALAVGFVFLLVIERLLAFIGITLSDFMIAGGLLLFILCLGDLLSYEKKRRQPDPESMGVVPVAVPMMVGPAVLTTGLLMTHEFGLALTGIALSLNLVLAGLALWFHSGLLRLLGRYGALILSRLSSLLLAAFAVMMVRRGIQLFMQ